MFWLYTVLSMTHYFSDISFAFSQSLGEKFSLITTGGHVSFQLLFFTPRFLYDSFVIPEPEPFSKTTLNIWKFSVHVLLKPGLENFEHYFNCAIVW